MEQFIKDSWIKKYSQFILDTGLENWTVFGPTPDKIITKFTEEPILQNYFSKSLWRENSKNAPLKKICSFPEKPWNWYEISDRTDLTLEFILKHREYCIWKSISRNNLITMEIINAYPDLPWDWDCVCQNRNISLEMIIKDSRLCNWEKISRNESITIEEVLQNMELPWDWSVICLTKKLTPEIINVHPELFCHWQSLSMNPNLTIDLIAAFSEKLIWYTVALNTTLDVKIILECVPKNVDSFFWIFLASNKNLTMEIIQQYLEMPWNWEHLCRNPNLTMKMIKDTLDKPWRWDMMSLAYFEQDRQDNIESCAILWMAVYKIKKWWVKLFWDPRTKIGIKRLERSYNDDNFCVWNIT